MIFESVKYVDVGEEKKRKTQLQHEIRRLGAPPHELHVCVFACVRARECMSMCAGARVRASVRALIKPDRRLASPCPVRARAHARPKTRPARFAAQRRGVHRPLAAQLCTEIFLPHVLIHNYMQI